MCQRSHEDIQPQKVHWSVQAALIRRGGVKTGELIMEDQIEPRLAALRTAVVEKAAARKRSLMTGDETLPAAA
eukprot:8022104-Heterocapsa_arctica.AAC.1